jgi:phosphoenolpyruvate synthase/pyruvate phosphate dikinase
LCASQLLIDVAEAHPNSAICWLGQTECHDKALVGGKAAHLSRLAAAFRVPPGFCLTTAAFDHLTLHSDALVESVQSRSGFTDEVYEALAQAYAKLGERCGEVVLPVAIRSSAVDEDGIVASFAGQHETLLNIVGVEAITQAAMHCWRSGRSARALAYRLQHGFASDRVRLAVLVQPLVVADSSAVVFSANPITGNRDELVINASWGLGESIVGGTMTPDTYVLREADLTVIARHIAEKRRMTVPVAGGTCEVDVPRFLRHRPALSDDQVVELGRLAVALEATMGGPVDFECAYQASRLYLLQCRPITALPRERNSWT